MTTTAPLHLSEEMLPAIKAVVIRRRTWLAIGWLALWGLANVGIFLMLRQEFGTLARTGPGWWMVVGIGVISGLMLLSAGFGLLTRHPRTIQAGAAMVGVVGMWNVATSLHSIQATGEEPRWIVIGVFQVLFAVREIAIARRILSWLPETEGVGEDLRRQTHRQVQQFCKLPEDYDQGRLALTLRDKAFLSQGVAKGCRGQVLDGMVLLVTRRLDDCICLTPEQVRAGTFTAAGLRVTTHRGPCVLRFGPASQVRLKQWAQLGVSEKELQAAMKRKEASMRLLETFLASPAPQHRLEVVRALPSFRTRGEPITAMVIAAVDDADPAVQAAALDACTAMRLDRAQEQAIVLLHSDDARVRAAAARYLAALPTSTAAGDIQTALQHETDRTARRDLQRALSAAEQAGANPYAMR